MNRDERLDDWLPDDDHHLYGEKLKKRLDKIDRIFLIVQKGVSILLWILGGLAIIIGLYHWDPIWAAPSLVSWIGGSLLWPKTLSGKNRT